MLTKQPKAASREDKHSKSKEVCLFSPPNYELDWHTADHIIVKHKHVRNF